MKNRKKKVMLACLLCASMMSILMASTAFGAGWIKDDYGWWYSTNDSNTEWLSHGWHWVDGNNDGSAECYWFDEKGYIMENFISMDGFTCNADGAWHINGVVQTKEVEAKKAADTASETNDSGIGWRQDSVGIWYSTNESGTEWLKHGHWIDDNNDGIEEYYCFNENGYLVKNMNYHGSDLNDKGQWIFNGIVQTKKVGEKHILVTGLENLEPVKNITAADLDTNFADEIYNEYGINRTAMEMITQTREQNKKYGEVSEGIDEGTFRGTAVTYQNGFVVTYNTGFGNNAIKVDPTRTDIDNTLLLKFYFDNHQYYQDRVKDTIEKDALLRELGFNVVTDTSWCYDHVECDFVHNGRKIRLFWYCSDRLLMGDITIKRMNTSNEQQIISSPNSISSK